MSAKGSLGNESGSSAERVRSLERIEMSVASTPSWNAAYKRSVVGKASSLSSKS